MKTRHPLNYFLAAAPLLALTALAFAAPPAATDKPAVAPPADFDAKVTPLTVRYCVPCHGVKDPPGGVNLVPFATVADWAKSPDTTRRVAARLRERTMPPPGAPQPPEPQRADVLAAFDALAAAHAKPASATVADPGRVLLHRLNRVEFNNTVRDLTGVDTHPADAFPADGSGGGGFDNDADTLFLPSILMERYLQAAGDVLQAAKPEMIAPVRPQAGKVEARDAACADIARFATRAFRRPAPPDEIDRYLALFLLATHHGAAFDDALRLPYKAILVSPNFLYRSELNVDVGTAAGKSTVAPLSDYALASRLSYFLWSSMPDDALLADAASGRLHEPAVLTAQTRRMLRDPKARALSENFVGQWLRTRELLTTAKPDPNRFPDYTPALRDALTAEPTLLFDDILRHDSNLLMLLSANFTYLNEPLAKFYGIAGVQGPEMRRVTLPAGCGRGGILTSGAVLTLTSYPLRTSPVLRGKWVLEQVLGTPVPPPPANVATLSPDDAVNAQGLTFRQRLEQHRTKPECVGCHSRMDPLGFGLENFDAVGRWRDTIAGKPVDATGVLTSGEKFAGPNDLKRLLLARRDDFARNLSEKMLSYALGRGLNPNDTPAVQKITDALHHDDYRATTLIEQVVTSYPFRYRSAETR